MQQVVMPFDGQVIEVVCDEQGTPWVSVRSVCQAIGVAPNNQIEKLKKDDRFDRYDIISPSVGGPQNTFCIPVEQLNGWLFSINPNKVSDIVRPKLIAYQQECFRVLYNHFLPKGSESVSSFMSTLLDVQATVNQMNAKFDYLTGMDLTVFGDDAPVIKELIDKAAKKRGVTTKDIWGLVRRECDVSSYKMQNRKIINFLKNLLGEGISIVKSEPS